LAEATVFEPSHVSKSPEKLPIPHAQLKKFGHTRENGPGFLRAPMARVVRPPNLSLTRNPRTH
jgi:hypothetical protein